MNGLQHAGAFVVQFQSGTDVITGRTGGRVEHVASGKATRFESIDELLEFFARVLKDVPVRQGHGDSAWNGD